MIPGNNQSVVVTGGYDARVRFWTWNGPAKLTQQQEIYVAMPVQQMSCVWPLLVTAHQQRLVHIWDLEKAFNTNNFQPTEVIEATLKFPLTSVQCFADGKGFCLGSIEGRC